MKRLLRSNTQLMARRHFATAPTVVNNLNRRGAYINNEKIHAGHGYIHVVVNAREVCIGLYKRMLEEVKVIPTYIAYRQNLEGICSYRLEVMEATYKYHEIEQALECGIMEEIVDQAQGELDLLRRMIEWEPWKIPEDHMPILEVDGKNVDWVELRHNRMHDSVHVMKEYDIKPLLKNSNPDVEIYGYEPRKTRCYQKDGSVMYRNFTGHH